jgi:hypothetical protein
MEYMKKIRSKYNPSLRYYYMGYYVYNCKKSIYKEHMHPQKLLCPISYQYTPLTKELKEKIHEYKFFKLIEDAPDWEGADPDILYKKLILMRFIYNRKSWLALSSVREEVKNKILKNVTTIHRILGDIFVEKFLFEYT